jgi:hypothetical protein
MNVESIKYKLAALAFKPRVLVDGQWLDMDREFFSSLGDRVTTGFNVFRFNLPLGIPIISRDDLQLNLILSLCDDKHGQ